MVEMMGCLVEMKRKKMVMEMILWWLWLLEWRRKWRRRIVEGMVVMMGENDQPRRAWLLIFYGGYVCCWRRKEK